MCSLRQRHSMANSYFVNCASLLDSLLASQPSKKESPYFAS